MFVRGLVDELITLKYGVAGAANQEITTSRFLIYSWVPYGSKIFIYVYCHIQMCF